MLMTGDYNSAYAGHHALCRLPFHPPTICRACRRNRRVYFYNPTGAVPLTVTRTTAGGATTNINVPANGTNFNDINNSRPWISLYSVIPFAMIAAVDYNAVNPIGVLLPFLQPICRPWRCSVLPKAPTQRMAAMAPITIPRSLSLPVCNTYLYVDINGDGTPDKVSFNNDIDVDDAAVPIGGVNYDETTSDQGIPVNQFQAITIGGPAGSLKIARGCGQKRRPIMAVRRVVTSLSYTDRMEARTVRRISMPVIRSPKHRCHCR